MVKVAIMIPGLSVRILYAYCIALRIQRWSFMRFYGSLPPYPHPTPGISRSPCVTGI